MDKRILQTYSMWAKENLEKQIEISLKTLGINSDKDIKKAKRVGDVTLIDGDANSYPADLYGKRASIVSLVADKGYKNIIEEFAYTWFNRFVALRFMELHDFLPHGLRVLSNRSGDIEPEILKNIGLVKDELRLNIDECAALKEQNKLEELFRYVLSRQCSALADILPMLFSKDNDHLELLLPKVLLKGDTVLTKLLEIPGEAFLEEVEIIGWMYQFYISAKKDEVNKAKKTITKDTLPAVTQLFTPEWIVRYMAENSVGRLWLESYPDSPLRSDMKYYVDDAEQTEEVQSKIDEIKYRNVNPEEIRVIEPCCGSGHILVYVFDLLYKMYDERGYQTRDIPTLILTKNLVGLDVDKRASQLASFALIMKARSINPRFFSKDYYVKPKVFEILDSRYLININYKKHLTDLQLLNEDEIKEITYIVEAFKNAKTIGSLIRLEPIDFARLNGAIKKIETDAVGSVFNGEFISNGVKLLKKLSEQAKVLSDKYDVMITNPPYIGTSSMEPAVKEYAAKHYPNSKTDMFAMFMETDFVKRNGLLAMINMHSWMFLSSYERLRESLLASKEIMTMAHLGARAFEEIGGEVVQTSSFVLLNSNIEDFEGTYIRLVDYNSQQAKEEAFLAGSDRYITKKESFKNIPSCPVAYWVSHAILKSFEKGIELDELSTVRQGIIPGNVEAFIRLWYEVCYCKIGYNHSNSNDINTLGKKWFPYNKGGPFRRWYGNIEHLINMENNGYDIKNLGLNNNYRLREAELYFQEAVTWSKISSGNFSARYMPKGHLFDISGCCVFFLGEKLNYILGFCNSIIATTILNAISPTLNYEVDHIKRLPIITSEQQAQVSELVLSNIALSSSDWDSFETSWDFKKHPLAFGSITVESAYKKWAQECDQRFAELKSNEEEINRIFIKIYGLQTELKPEIENKEVTVRLADKERDIKSLISYLVGIVMGRYSLDIEGLAYAGGDWDDSKYRSYKPDDDGIISVYSKLGMEDGLTAKITELIKLIYGEDTYRQNIDFIAEALGKNNNESPEETLNRYLNDGFYADHLKIYQKRPIYWMFSSGKNNGFKCLIYMHRYNEDTLARINGMYFLPESTRLKNEMEELLTRIEGSEGRERIRLEKERTKLAAAYNEAIEYGQVLDHMANKYISIDLDDGVKVNYAKFQEVELITDSGTKVKKDLLVPIK